MTHEEKAVQYYENGYLCSQAVLAAYAEEYGLTEEQALKLGTCLGAGMRMGEVCGACTGVLMVLGLVHDDPNLIEYLFGYVVVPEPPHPIGTDCRMVRTFLRQS